MNLQNLDKLAALIKRRARYFAFAVEGAGEATPLSEAPRYSDAQ